MSTQNSDGPAASSDFKTELVEAFKAAMPAQQQQPQQRAQPTQEQIQQMLGYWRPDQQFLAGLFGDSAGDQHAQLMGTFLERIEEMVDKRASVIAQGMLGDFYGNVKPHLDDASSLAEERFREKLFSGAGESLKPFETLIDKLMPQLRQEEGFPAARKEQIPYLHEKLGALVKQANPAYTGTTQGQPRQSAPVAALPAFGGGAGGSGGGGGKVDLKTATEPMSLAQVMQA